MRVLVGCVRGNVAEHDKGGHCLCADCKAAAYARRRAWVKAHPERARAYSAKWIAGNKEQRRAIEKSWRDRHPEKAREMSSKAGAKWSAGKGRGKRNSLTRARIAAKLQRTPPWADMAAIVVVYEEAARLTVETGIPHEVDHILPLQGETVSGLHVAENLQILTRSANRSKQNHYGGPVPSEF